MNRTQLDLIIKKVGVDLGWIPYKVNQKFIVAKTSPSFWSGSWGEQITILFDGDYVLVNSICDLDKKSSVVSMGRNRQNETTLIEAIRNASS